LWTSDGTEAGTALTKDITPGKGGYGPVLLTGSDGTLFFTADDGVHGREIWKSDGTRRGTALVKDIHQHPGHVGLDTYGAMRGGTLFFNANDAVHGKELWRSDGTDEGTTLIKDINASERTREAARCD
jgi:ELWxxDGT repeat protein